MTDETLPRFVRWETPFTDTRWPGALLYTSNLGPVSEFTVTAVVMPFGVYKYPKHLVHFGEVIAFTCMEEMHFPARDFADAIIEEEGLAAYQYLNSTWLNSYKKGEYFLFNTTNENKETLRHYLIVGGDNNIEIITKNEPVFETVDKSTTLQVPFTI